MASPDQTAPIGKTGLIAEPRVQLSPGGFDYMADFLGMILGNIVNLVAFISHLVIVFFRNFVFFAFILAFFYGIYRLCRVGLDKFRGRGKPQEQPAPGDEVKNGGE